MHTRRRILIGVLALALPIGTVAGLSTAASAKPVPNPVNCTGFNGTVTFGSPLTVSGVITTSKLGNPTTILTGAFNCGGGTGNAATVTNPLSIAGGKNVKSTSYNKKLCKAAPTNTTVCDKYIVGTWAEFSGAGSSIKKSFKSVSLTINGNAVIFQAKGSQIEPGGLCGPDVGFDITGQVKAGVYDTKTANILACLGTTMRADASTGEFLTDLNFLNSHGGDVSAQLDPAHSSATL